MLPLPDAGCERIPAQLLPGCSFGGELALDHHLRGDAGVVGAGDPERGFAQHAVPAGEDVHLGLVEHVAHVQAAGDVGRGQEDGEGGAAIPTHASHGWGTRTFRGGDFEEAFADPVLGPVLLDCGGVVGLGEGFRLRCGGRFLRLFVTHG
jgi:hypothetical protein